jgi:hypothetical protein
MGMKAKAASWAPVLLSVSAPLTVAAITIARIDVPKVSPLLGDLAPPLNPWVENLPGALVASALPGVATWLAGFVLERPAFRSMDLRVRIVAAGLLITIMMSILWLAILLVHLRVILRYAYGPMLGLPTIEPWVLTLGAGWTIAIILLVFSAIGQAEECA